MSEETSLIPDEARARIGSETARATGRVVKQEFQRWAAAVKDRNPLYFDADFARAHGYRDVVMPPMYLSHVTLGVADLDALRPDGIPGGGGPNDLPLPNTPRRMAGGESIAFHDTTANNEGGAYRTGAGDGVDVEAGASGFDVGWTHATEWMKYTVNVTAGGTYTFDAHVANAAAGGAFHVEVDGVNVTGSLAVPNTASFKTYTDVLKSGISLTAGSHVIRWVWDANTQYGFAGNLDWFKFS